MPLYERYYGVTHYEFYPHCKSDGSNIASSNERFNLELRDYDEDDTYICLHIDEYFEEC